MTTKIYYISKVDNWRCKRDVSIKSVNYKDERKKGTNRTTEQLE